MEGKLIKKDDGYALKICDKFIAVLGNNSMNYLLKQLKFKPEYNLSLKNCQAIERGYDLDELVKEQYPIDEPSFKRGFKLALETLGDKKFVVQEFLDTWFDVDDTLSGDPVWVDSQGLQVITPKQLNNLYQQTEWEVEVQMEKYGFCEGCRKAGMWHCAHADSCGGAIELERPKLDADGCLILKRKI